MGTKMRSFISTFKSRSKRSILYGTGAVVFLLSFGLSALLGEMAFRQGWGWRGELAGADLGSRDYSLTEIKAGLPEMYLMLYQGIGQAIQNAQEADVLLLGNSRLLFAIREGPIRRFEEKTGLKIFNMSLDGGDGYPLALEILKRYPF